MDIGATIKLEFTGSFHADIGDLIVDYIWPSDDFLAKKTCEIVRMGSTQWRFNAIASLVNELDAIRGFFLFSPHLNRHNIQNLPVSSVYHLFKVRACYYINPSSCPIKNLVNTVIFDYIPFLQLAVAEAKKDCGLKEYQDGFKELLPQTIRYNSPHSFKFFIDHKLDVNERDLMGRTPLHTAVAKVGTLPDRPNGSDEAFVVRDRITSDYVLKLIAAKADVNGLSGDNKTPLYFAVEKAVEMKDFEFEKALEITNLVQILLDNGARNPVGALDLPFPPQEYFLSALEINFLNNIAKLITKAGQQNHR